MNIEVIEHPPEPWTVMSMRKMIVMAAIAFLFPVWTVPPFASAGEAASPAYTATLVDDLTRRQPVDGFSCQDTVYVLFAWYGLKSGIYKVTVKWFNPKGEPVDETNLKFAVEKKKDKVENFVSLKFLNEKSERNPLLPDFSVSKFDGNWEARVFLEGTFLEARKFNVVCY